MSLPARIDGRIWGVDTSACQGSPTYLAALRAAGCAFHFARAHTGNSVDTVWAATAAEAERLGVPFGAYGVVRNRGPVDAERQARAFLDAVRGTRRELPDVLDWELPVAPRTMSRAEAVANIKAARVWRDVVSEATGRAVLVYCGMGFVDAVELIAGEDGAEDLAALAADSPCFAAHYTQSALRLPTVPRAWRKTGWVLWQGSGDRAVCRNACQIPGRGCDVDIDWFRGTVDDLRALGMDLPVSDVRQGR